MLAIITSLLGLADPIARIAGRIADARIAATQAATDKERIEQEERVKALRAESDGRVNGVVRALLAAPVVVFLWKVIIWDKVLALGTTDDLSENLWYVTMMVLGFYYLHWTVGRLKR
jgi:hypothetical protein